MPSYRPAAAAAAAQCLQLTLKTHCHCCRRSPSPTKQNNTTSTTTTPHGGGLPAHRQRRPSAEGNVGERGEEFVVAQFLLLLFVAMGSVPLIGGLAMFLVGPGFLAGGIGLCAAGVKGLAKSLSPWPAPVKDNVLETEGVYGLVRHPMYTGE